MSPDDHLAWSRVGPAGDYERAMGPSELAFFPQSVLDGIGDMFLHLSFRAPPQLLVPDRVAAAWAILRARHPVLAAKLVVRDEERHDVRFVYTPLRTPEEALAEARACLTFSSATKQELIDAHMNGPRALSNTHLSHLTISTASPPPSSSSTTPHTYNLFFTAPHFTGDGTTLHASTHELLLLLSLPTLSSLTTALASALPLAPSLLPPGIESRLPHPRTRFQRAAQAVDYQLNQAKSVGGHTLPRAQRGKRRTVMREVAFDEERTDAVLRRCKEEGVSVSNAMFALTAIAWARTTGKPAPELPIMMYTALNLRPYLLPTPSPPPSYWFIALGYFNIVLPSFLPSSTSSLPKTFWHRARSARAQTTLTTSSPLLIPRCLHMSAERCARALSLPAPSPQIIPLRAPSQALCGLSLIGNLDRTYLHAAYHPQIELQTVTTASRQRAGGLLLLEHTFRGRLWLHLAWDENGFEEGVVERFWEELRRGVGEFMG